MRFAHDTEVALAATAELVNTASGGEELLPDPDALAVFVTGWRAENRSFSAAQTLTSAATAAATSTVMRRLSARCGK